MKNRLNESFDIGLYLSFLVCFLENVDLLLFSVQEKGFQVFSGGLVRTKSWTSFKSGIFTISSLGCVAMEVSQALLYSLAVVATEQSDCSHR